MSSLSLQNRDSQATCSPSPPLGGGGGGGVGKGVQVTPPPRSLSGRRRGPPQSYQMADAVAEGGAVQRVEMKLGDALVDQA